MNSENSKHRNVLFTIRRHATHHEEFVFAVTVLAERIRLHDKEHPIDIERGFEIINKVLRDKVEELQREEACQKK